MSEEKIIRAFAVYNRRKNQIRSVRQTGRLNIFDWYRYAEEVKLEEDEVITPVHIVIEEVVDE